MAGTFTVLVPESCSRLETTTGPYFGNGFRNGWADQHSIVIWTRLTRDSEMNLDGARFIPLSPQRLNELDLLGDPDSILSSQVPDTLQLDDMLGACPGAAGEVMLTYHSMEDGSGAVEIPWTAVDPERNFTCQWKLEGLEANTRYAVTIYARRDGLSAISDTISGTFITPPEPHEIVEARFCIVTCHDFNRRDDPVMGHRIYPSMLASVPDFYVHTGDAEYYDQPDPWAMSEDLMRFKWDRLFALPYQRRFFTEVTTYFLKDDHDLLRNDAFPGMKYGSVTFERGMEIFDQEQFPAADKPYKTIRWGPDLQIWLMEGRNYRSSNDMEDGPGKTIWGKEQKEWLFTTLEESEASFRLIISPTPILGPDRGDKNDNHANLGFRHEGEEVRAFLNRFDNVIICNGDRHWQYVTHMDGTGLWEFGCGAGSDMHAGGWDPDDLRPEHRFLRIGGGYLSGKVTRLGDKAVLFLQHCDVEGNVVHEEKFERDLLPFN